MRIPIAEVQKQVEAETTKSVSGAPTAGLSSEKYKSGRHTFRAGAGSNDSFTVGEDGEYECYVTYASQISGSDHWTISYSGATIRAQMGSGSPGVTYTCEVSYSYRYKTRVYEGVTKTIDLGDDKFVTAVSVVSQSPSSATVTPTKTEHGASVYLYQASTSTITATIKLEYYYYETVKEAKVKHNGVIYKHIKFNGQVIV